MKKRINYHSVDYTIGCDNLKTSKLFYVIIKSKVEKDEDFDTNFTQYKKQLIILTHKILQDYFGSVKPFIIRDISLKNLSLSIELNLIFDNPHLHPKQFINTTLTCIGEDLVNHILCFDKIKLV
jgi:hypothetical protein